MLNKIINHFRGKRELRKRLLLKKIKDGKQKAIKDLLDNPKMIKTASKGVNLIPVLVAKNIVEQWQREKLLNLYYRPITDRRGVNA